MNAPRATPHEHISGIYDEYTTPSRVLQSFTNLSNTVIQTALSGQNKFLLELLQNADDSFDEEHGAIQVQFILEGDYLIVQHDGKGFDYNDAERLCDYASQIEEVKSTDLSKTGYKGLGFKSLFNLSDSIYIHSNGYSFRFDKTHWSDVSNRPWQVIPIWTNYDELPLKEKYSFDQPVNFILRINGTNHLKSSLKELVDQPEVLLYLNRIDKLSVSFDRSSYCLERKVGRFGLFNKMDIYNNRTVVSTWLLKTYKRNVPERIQNSMREGSHFIYPDKIKTAKEVPFTFALRSDQAIEEILKVRGLFHSTLPTQLQLKFPYHINSHFILNLDRTQLHENEWNEFLIHQLGDLQFTLLKDLAEMPHLKNYVVMLFVREIHHSYTSFRNAFLKGFNDAKNKVAWLPAYEGSRLLKLCEAWVDETDFFKQNLQNIRNEEIQPYLIDYDVKEQSSLSQREVHRFTYDQLFSYFPHKYYPQLNQSSYRQFISYLFKSYRDNPYSEVMSKLRKVTFLVTKNRTLQSPEYALLEETEYPIPDFLFLNPVDNEYLPLQNSMEIKNWLDVNLGTKRLTKPIHVIRESVLKWLDSRYPDLRRYKENHIRILNYIAKGVGELSIYETERLKKNLPILTESKEFAEAESCYFPDAVSIKELADVISDRNKISSLYDIDVLRNLFTHLGVKTRLDPFDVLRKIIEWIENNKINCKITRNNYTPIIEYISQHYPAVQYKLGEGQIKELKNFPILTCDGSFRKAKDCYFDSALLGVKGLECVLPESNVVSIENISSDDVHGFLKKIGVSEKMSPIEVLRRSVLKWIEKGEIENKITLDNHHSILEYIAEQWSDLCIFSETKERKALEKFPVLTKSSVFRPAYKCYMPNDSGEISNKEIPGLECIFSSDEFVSSDYMKDEDDDGSVNENKSDERKRRLEKIKKVKSLLKNLGVRDLKFTDIYEKYSDILTCPENVKWFFSELIKCWSTRSYHDTLLKYLQEKFTSSSCLLARGGNMHISTDLYSSKFKIMHDIDSNAVPLLDLEEDLPQDLEKWLKIKTELDLPCIVRLLEAIRKNPILGEDRTRAFFKMLLEQLSLKGENEIRKYSLSLLSQDNKLKLANELYYFKEEGATCHLNSCYLKTISGMSHKETLKLAELCGVNIMTFKQEIILGKPETPDSTLKEFYLKRLPFIVLQESKELTESDIVVLKRLYDKVCAIELYKCHEIHIKYEFDSPCKIRHHFDDLKMYTAIKWNGHSKSKFHEHLKKQLCFKTDITQITDMEIESEDIEDWLNYNEESKEKLHSIEKKLQKLITGSTLTSSPDEKGDHSDESDGEGNCLSCEVSLEKESIDVKSVFDEKSSYVSVEAKSHLQTVSFSDKDVEEDDSSAAEKSCVQTQSSSVKDLLNGAVKAKSYSQTRLSCDENSANLTVEAESLQSPLSSDENSTNLAVVAETRVQTRSSTEEDLAHVSVEAKPCLQSQSSSIGKMVNLAVETKSSQLRSSSDEYSTNLTAEDESSLRIQSSPDKNPATLTVEAESSLETRPYSDENPAILSAETESLSQTQPTCDENAENESFHAKPRIQTEYTLEVTGSPTHNRVLRELGNVDVFERNSRRSAQEVGNTPLNEPEGFSCRDVSSTSEDEDIIEFDSRESGENAQKIDYFATRSAWGKEMASSDIPPSKGIGIRSIKFPNNTVTEKDLSKWLDENYITSFLRYHYRNSYSNSQFSIPDGVQLRSSPEIEVWVKENEGCEDSINLNIRWSIRREEEIHGNRSSGYCVPKTRIRMQHRSVFEGHFSSNRNFNTRPARFSQDVSEIRRIRFVDETIFLRNHYKNMYRVCPDLYLSGRHIPSQWRPSHKKKVVLIEGKHHGNSEDYSRLSAQNEEQVCSDSYYMPIRVRHPQIPRSNFHIIGNLMRSGLVEGSRQIEILHDRNTSLQNQYALQTSDYVVVDREITIQSQKVLKEDPRDRNRLLVQKEPEARSNCPSSYVQLPALPESDYVSIERVNVSHRISQDDSSKDCHVKWLGEKYVFTFLQDYYKNKYPGSEYSLSGGTFTLLLKESLKIEINWLNESVEKGRSYDLLVKKDGEIQQVIEVESTSATEEDSFNLSHGAFIKKKNDLAKELPLHEEKYRIYCVFNVHNPPTATCVANFNCHFALYKIVPLNAP